MLGWRACCAPSTEKTSTTSKYTLPPPPPPLRYRPGSPARAPWVRSGSSPPTSERLHLPPPGAADPAPPPHRTTRRFMPHPRSLAPLSPRCAPAPVPLAAAAPPAAASFPLLLACLSGVRRLYTEPVKLYLLAMPGRDKRADRAGGRKRRSRGTSLCRGRRRKEAVLLAAEGGKEQNRAADNGSHILRHSVKAGCAGPRRRAPRPPPGSWTRPHG